MTTMDELQLTCLGPIQLTTVLVDGKGSWKMLRIGKLTWPTPIQIQSALLAERCSR